MTETKKKPKAGAPTGNKNAQKPETTHRVQLVCMIAPETKKLLDELKATQGSLGRAVDHLAKGGGQEQTPE